MWGRAALEQALAAAPAAAPTAPPQSTPRDAPAGRRTHASSTTAAECAGARAMSGLAWNPAARAQQAARRCASSRAAWRPPRRLPQWPAGGSSDDMQSTSARGAGSSCSSSVPAESSCSRSECASGTDGFTAASSCGSDCSEARNVRGDSASSGENHSGDEHQRAPRVLYGAARRSTAKRLRAEQQRRAVDRGSHPSHAAYAAAQLDRATAEAIVVRNHRCTNTWLDDGEVVQCHHHLWARGVDASIGALQQQRAAFLQLNARARSETVYEALDFAHAAQLHSAAADWDVPMQRVVFCVGPSEDRKRVVCREIFLAQYPVSLATLKRLIARKRLGVGVRANEQQARLAHAAFAHASHSHVPRLHTPRS